MLLVCSSSLWSSARLHAGRAVSRGVAFKPVCATLANPERGRRLAWTRYTCDYLSPTLRQRAESARQKHNQLRLCTTSAISRALSQTTDESAPIQPLVPGLYLVGTPIGNLEDISLRALRILRSATIVLAEDTRHSQKLLNYFDIKAQLYSFHQHNEHAKQKVVLEQLARGAAVAIISDAGMPLISDPGSALVRATVAAGYQVVPVPGPSAFLLGLVASGLTPSPFTFAGFLAAKAKLRQRQLQDLADLTHTLVFYVPPHDLLAVLKDAAKILGPRRQCTVARELTKMHEEFFRDTLAAAIDHYNSVSAKGEITLLIQGADAQEAAVPSEDIGKAVSAAMASGQSLSSAAKTVSKQLGVSRSKAYAVALAESESGKALHADPQLPAS